MKVHQYLRVSVFLALFFATACQSEASPSISVATPTKNLLPQISSAATQRVAPASPPIPRKTVDEADQDAATPSARRMVEITQSPTRLATAIKIPDPSVKITPEPTTPNAGYKLNSSSPDLAVEVAHQIDSLFFCDFEQYPGKIWSLQYPYRDIQWRLADPKNAYYNPVWSPDGSMLAAISVELTPPTKRTQYPDALESEYPENERIWLISPDGLTKRQISQAYPRYQMNTSEGECLTSGLHGLLKWSFDSQWIAVNYGSFTTNMESFISFINVRTGQHYEIQNEIADGVWALDQNTFAMIVNSQKEIIVIEVKDSGIEKSTFSYPPGVGETVYFTNLVWENNDKIIVIGRQIDATNKIELWELATANNQWSQRFTFNRQNAVYVIDPNSIALCEQRDNNTIDLFNVPNKFIETRITNPSEIDCYTIMPVIQQNKTIGLSYFSYPYSTEIWFSNLSGVSQKVFAIKDIHFPEDYEVGSVSWRP
jgi:hypothetical protein